jgi:hypothetical protein
MTAQSDMPLGEIDAIDPYPFHGLVYRLTSTGFDQYLDPRDGRPVINLPPAPSVSTLYCPTYFGATDGVLWDIGRVDPPSTPAIEASGGKALGKRILARNLLYPARLGENTKQLGLSALPVNQSSPQSPIKVSWHFPVSVGPVTQFDIGTFALSDFGVDPNNLLDENAAALITGPTLSAFDFSFFGVPVAISKDGTRRLLRALISLQPGQQDSRVFTVGYVEVVFSLNLSDEIVASASVVKTITQVVGTVTRSVSADTRRLVASGGGFASGCVRSYSLISDPTMQSSSSGTSSLSIERAGIVIGATYKPDNSIEYFTLGQSITRTVSGTASRDSESTGTPQTVGGVGECSAPAGPPSPLVQSGSSASDVSMTIALGAFSLTASAGSNTSGSAVDGSGSTTLTSSSSAGTSISRTGGWVAPVIQLFGTTTPGPGTITIPKIEESLKVADHELLLVQGLSGWQAMSIAVSTATFGVFDLWRAPMITPTGIKLSYTKEANVDGPTFVYRGAYSPLTGQAARNGDVPEQIIDGWI